MGAPMPLLRRSATPHLARLRFAALAAAALLLITAIVVASLAVRNGSQTAGTVVPVHLAIKPEAIASRVVADQREVVASYDRTEPASPPAPEPADPNRTWNERTAAAVGKFVLQYGLEGETFDKPQFLDAIRYKAAQWGDATLAADYAEGLALATEKTLTDPGLISLFETPTAKPGAVPGTGKEGDAAAQQPAGRLYRGSPANVVNGLIETYAQQFFDKAEKRSGEQARAELETTIAKATGMTQIYLAASAFSAGLMLVFIAIALAIEQRLRALGGVERPDGSQTEADGPTHP
jgi:hypothetical protein